MTRISEHYDLSQCNRAELLQLKAVYESAISHNRRKTLAALLGWQSTEDGLAQINALLAEKYPEQSHD